MCRVFIIVVLFLSVSLQGPAQQTHPLLILTKKGVDQIKTGGEYPGLYQKSYDQASDLVNREIEKGIDVPIPKDMAGGYTHERHKLNYKVMQQAGFLYQLSGDERYAVYIRDMFMEYAAMFGTLPIHPTVRSYATGKIFWQCLNDANWLVYTSQAYDCIYDFLTEQERGILEQKLFKPFADFISVENPQFFNRVHNHSAWGNAAVGMIALVMNDEERLNRALYGLDIGTSNADLFAKDNDGGYIHEHGKSKAGFFAQLDHSFSPDGYYTEGPYYQRYAMTPFMLFALALENVRPDIKVFEYRNGVLLKAVGALINQSNSKGEFFPINDAQKGMSVKAFSVVSAIDITFQFTKDPTLLDIAIQQDEVRLDQSGYKVAKGIEENLDRPFIKRSTELRDGANGDQGALGILRAFNDRNEEITVVFKYAAHGMGHGHFDKLSYFIYDNATEIIQDYGAARWVNIDQKAGGRYLEENKSWAKQSIAHNTLVIDQKSHFEGNYDRANSRHCDPWYFNVSNENFQIVSARENNAYPGTQMQRTLLLWKDSNFVKPLVIDLFAAHSDKKHLYELPFHFRDHLMTCNFSYSIPETPYVLGKEHGYQHLLLEAESDSLEGNIKFSWFRDGKFFSLTSLSDRNDKVLFARLGANDPQFNLRRDALLIHQKLDTRDPLFLSVIESHGSYSPVNEIPENPYTRIKELKLIYHTKEYTVFTIESTEGKLWEFMLAHDNKNEDMLHELIVGGKRYFWKGPFAINH
jgi:hypothetical protein